MEDVHTDVTTGVPMLLRCNSFNLKLLYLKSDFTQTLVYLNPALNNSLAV